MVYLDSSGIIRWCHDDRELTLFGVNYCLPSACDYRAAGYVNASRKHLIDQDLNHFERMGFDGLRLSFWGDWENTDKYGNLIHNDHLDLLDYLISKAKEKGIYMLFSPIVTYSSLWPENLDDTTAMGFSSHFSKRELGVDENAIAAQINYLKQILNHVNSYTGIAYKNEPNIIIIEPINEPLHHPEEISGTIRYINGLVNGIRETGCEKLVFFNVSQDFNIIPALGQSRVQGTTYAWYPTQLMNGRILRGNHLHHVDKYDQMLLPGLDGKGKIVYEFDSPDVIDSYMYPAMVREFRAGGVQFACMFSYDMLATAHANLGWQTHYLNMVYTPSKAVSAIIAGKAMHELPRLQNFGRYPENTRFGNFRVSYEENLSEYITDTVFIYSNHTKSKPERPELLRRVVGYGSSPVIDYEGSGVYFLDKIQDGIWKLEVYPDAVLIDDPFKPISITRPVCRILYRQWTMKINLEDIGESYKVCQLNGNNSFQSTADKGIIRIHPGVFLLYNSDEELIKKIIDTTESEYISPTPQKMPLQVLHKPKQEHINGTCLTIDAKVLSTHKPNKVTCHIRNSADNRIMRFEMENITGYTYTVSIEPDSIKIGHIEYCIIIEENGSIWTYPDTDFEISPVLNNKPDKFWKTIVRHIDSPLPLFEAKENRSQLTFSRVYKSLPYTRDFVPGSSSDKLALRIHVPDFKPDESYISPMDISFDHFIRDKLELRHENTSASKSFLIAARATNQFTDKIGFILVDVNGFSWGTEVPLSMEWETVEIPISSLQPMKAAMLPQDWPGVNEYWYRPDNNNLEETYKMDLNKIEKMQISIRADHFPLTKEYPHGYEMESIIMTYE